MTLYDIFPTVEIVEYSLYYFIFFSLLLIIVLWYLIWFYLKHKKRSRNYYISLLEKSIEGDAKHTAHKFSYYGNHIVHTDEQKKKSGIRQITDSTSRVIRVNRRPVLKVP